MTFTWDAKNNFILSHGVTLYQPQASTADKIHWPSIVNEIRLEISSTPSLLKDQYEQLLNDFHPIEDAASLYSTLNHRYLRSLCQKIEADQQVTLEIVYELVRHVRAKRIDAVDIEKVFTEWNSHDSSKACLVIIFTRLQHYIRTLSKNPTHQQAKRDDNEETARNRSASNSAEREKSDLVRRRTRSLTLHVDTKQTKVNVGLDWFVPKLQRQQRSASLHVHHRSLGATAKPPRSNVRCTSTQPTISWLPLTNEQVAEKERSQMKSKFFDRDQLDQVSSSDSDSIEIQSSSNRLRLAVSSKDGVQHKRPRIS